MSSLENQLRQQMVVVARSMVEQGLNKGTAGNVGCRSEDGFWVTPSGCPVEQMQAGDIVKMGFDGQVLSPENPPANGIFIGIFW